MSDAAIELLVLDGQGVVFNDPLAEHLDSIADSTGQPRDLVRARWRDDVRELAWRGTIDDARIWRELAGNDHRWGDALESRYVPGPAAPRLSAWATHVPIWLLTNHRAAWIERRLERFGLRQWFSRVLVSDAIRSLKPEKGAFASVLAHVSDAATVLFVDDQEKNVDAARELGLSTLFADPTGHWLPEVDRRLRARCLLSWMSPQPPDRG